MIPNDIIEQASKYSVLPKREKKPVSIGGPIMMNLVVRDQMELDNIIAQMGTQRKNCMIIVDYTLEEVLTFIDRAKAKLERMKGGKN